MEDEVCFKNPTFEEQQRVLHSPFDPKTHRETFIGYFEAIIRTDGTVEYAVPSHTFKLGHIYGKSPEDMFEDFQNEAWGIDSVEWLCKKTACLAVWETRYVGTPNEKQLETLQMLKDNHIYKGAI
jgi:hypothetical protein